MSGVALAKAGHEGARESNSKNQKVLTFPMRGIVRIFAGFDFAHRRALHFYF
jgi:hypothetical protein